MFGNLKLKAIGLGFRIWGFEVWGLKAQERRVEYV